MTPPPTDAGSPLQQFGTYFDLALADPLDTREPAHDADLIDRARHLRYEVYCREFGFEREEDCPGQRESDAWDGRSLHCLLLHHASGRDAGTVRLVLADPAEPAAPLPFVAHCGASLHADHPAHPARFAPGLCCEVSRLAVGTAFRRRPGEAESPIGQIDGLDISAPELRTYPLISLALFVAATRLVSACGCAHAYAIMEPRLARRLGSAGLVFERIGDDIEYHGRRAAFHIHIDTALAATASLPGMGEMYTYALARLDPQILPARLRPALAGSF